MIYWFIKFIYLLKFIDIELHNDLPFLLEKVEFKKFEAFVTNLYDKTEYVIYIRNLKQALNHEATFKKIHRVKKFKQKSCLKHILIWILSSEKQ